MEKEFAKLAVENYKNGFSCSESVVKVAIENGLCDENLLDVATSFSGGMSSGCLCGAIAGAQMVLGSKHGRTKTGLAREKAAQFMDEFKKMHKATCCRFLTKGLEFGSKERKENCAKLVCEASRILEKLI